MDILTKPPTGFTFEFIQEFVKENHPEGVELDYKEQFPDKEKLSQTVVAFANTRGGVILVGVKENRENGRPVKADGIDDGHHDEFVAQIIGNISPIPAYDFHKTNDKEGKVFVLIRVFEGDETPYYPHNDSNIWIRTGSVKKPVDIASPEHAELLFKKKDRAELGRKINRQCALDNYQAFLDNAEHERQKEIDIEKENYRLKKLQHEDGDKLPPFRSSIIQNKVGENSAMLTILLQPYFPHEQLIKPRDIEPVIQSSQVYNHSFSFPILAARWDSIQEGMCHFNWNRRSGEVDCQQVFANGLMFSLNDVLRTHQGYGTYTHLSWFTSQLYITLKGSKNVLEKIGYQGTLIGSISVEGVRGHQVYPIIESMFRDENNHSVFALKEWSIKIDTRTLSDENKLREYVVDLCRDIHWSFGYKDLQKSITVKYLIEKGYFT